jgi:hypothetical protein
MALGVATRRATEGKSVSEATALIEGDEGREAFCGHRLDWKPLRCFARTPTHQAEGRRAFCGVPLQRLVGLLGGAMKKEIHHHEDNDSYYE